MLPARSTDACALRHVPPGLAPAGRYWSLTEARSWPPPPVNILTYKHTDSRSASKHTTGLSPGRGADRGPSSVLVRRAAAVRIMCLVGGAVRPPPPTPLGDRRLRVAGGAVRPPPPTPVDYRRRCLEVAPVGVPRRPRAWPWAFAAMDRVAEVTPPAEPQPAETAPWAVGHHLARPVLAVRYVVPPPAPSAPVVVLVEAGAGLAGVPIVCAVLQPADIACQSAAGCADWVVRRLEAGFARWNLVLL